MAKLPTQDLNRAIIDAISASGASGVFVAKPDHNPRRVVAQFGNSVHEIWIYIWTLTHGGGRARPKDEYRIQITGVRPPLNLNDKGPTILIGYEPNLQCFAGFDVDKHLRFSPQSPSIQIPITVLEKALQNGFAFTRKGNDEIAVGFRPEQIMTYALNSKDLHRLGADMVTSGLLARAAALEQIPDEMMKPIEEERQRIVSTISRLARDAAFRRKVISAYEGRCAVTRMQLQLVDAAHILPVGVPKSSDEISNGLCLSPTYHRAYDRGLIYLDENYVMRINADKVQTLQSLKLSGGLDDFKSYLDKKIHLPVDPRQWPDKGLIAQANRYRGIPGY